jgi:ATP-dependent DNA ligase
VAFDVLAEGDSGLLDTSFGKRREALEAMLADAGAPVYATPATDAFDTAARWFDLFEGAGLDGVVAKPLAAPYAPDKRVMFKVKHERTADCVLAGYRWHRVGGKVSNSAVGSLLLGLYDSEGTLQHVGVAGAFPMVRRRELVDELAPLVIPDGGEHPWAQWAGAARESDRMPGATSRWNADKDLSWVALRPERVVEVAYDHMEGTRFRHTTQFRRWRPDRDASTWPTCSPPAVPVTLPG